MKQKRNTKNQTPDRLRQIGDWFAPNKTSRSKDGKSVAIDSTQFDIMVSFLVVSIVINLFFFSCWLIWQADPASRSGLVALLFN